MTTVINNPGDGSDSAASMVFLIIVLLLAVALFFIYGLPVIRDNEDAREDNSVDVNLTLPPVQESDPQTPSGY